MTQAPGVSPSEAIIGTMPVTLRIVGHEHTYEHRPEDHEVVCGNGGAPLTTDIDYGYGIIERVTSGAIQMTEYDYNTRDAIDRFRVNADGCACAVSAVVNGDGTQRRSRRDPRQKTGARARASELTTHTLSGGPELRESCDRRWEPADEDLRSRPVGPHLERWS